MRTIRVSSFGDVAVATSSTTGGVLADGRVHDGPYGFDPETAVAPASVSYSNAPSEKMSDWILACFACDLLR